MNPNLFKPELNAKAEEFKQYLPVNVNCSFRSLAPAIALCEKKYVLPIIGETLFSRLVSYYQCDEREENAYLQEILTLTQFALIRLAYWQDYDILSVNLSDKGATDNAGENRLYRYQTEAIKTSLKNDGFDQLDTLLEYCEQNIDHLPEFEQSPCRLAAEKSLIKNTREFNEIYNINNSRLVFLKMKYFISMVEELELKHHFGDSFCNELLSADVSLEIYERILPKIKKFIVFKSIAEGIRELHQIPTEKGLIFQSEKSASNSNLETTVISLPELSRTQEQYEQKAERYMSGVIDTLQNHIVDYPAYQRFAGDNAPRNEVFHRNNKNRKIFHA